MCLSWVKRNNFTSAILISKALFSVEIKVYKHLISVFKSKGVFKQTNQKEHHLCYHLTWSVPVNTCLVFYFFVRCIKYCIKTEWSLDFEKKVNNDFQIKHNYLRKGLWLKGDNSQVFIVTLHKLPFILALTSKFIYDVIIGSRFFLFPGFCSFIKIVTENKHFINFRKNELRIIWFLIVF